MPDTESGSSGSAEPRDWPGSLAPREVEGILGIPPSTLRVYAARFASLLSSGAEGGLRPGGRGFGHRRYTTADVAILEKIKALLDTGLSYDLVGAELGELTLPRRTARRRQISEPVRRGRRLERRVATDVSAPIVPTEEPSAKADALPALLSIDAEQIAREIVEFLPRSKEAELVNGLGALEVACAEQGRRLADLSRAVSSLAQTLDQVASILETMAEDRRERSRPGWLRRLLHLG